MAQVRLHSFYIVSVLQGNHRKGVPQIVDSRVRSACFLCQLFEMQIQPFGNEIAPILIGEHKGLLVLRLIVPCLPVIPGAHALHDLFRVPLLECLHHITCRAQNARLAVLGRRQLRAACRLRSALELLVDQNDTGVEIHAVPGEPEGFRLPQAGEQNHPEHGPVDIVGLGEPDKLLDLSVRQRLDLRFVHAGESGFCAEVFLDKIDLHRLLHGSPKDDVDILHTLGGKAAAV